MSQLSPPLYTCKNLFSLKFETGSYLLKSMEKDSVHIGKYQIIQHSEFSLETFFALSLQLKFIYQSV